MTYSSKYGEAFIMNCGKRHGTVSMGHDTAQDFRECMDKCAALVPCHSVDYHFNSGKVPGSTHH